MASERGLPAARIVRVVEVIVPMQVGAQCGMVGTRRQPQRGAAAPAADQLRGNKFPFFLGVSTRPEESIERADSRLIFAKAHKSAVSAEYVRLRHRQGEPGLTRISK